MSELSGLLVKEGYHINEERIVGPNTMRLLVSKMNGAFVIEFRADKYLLFIIKDRPDWQNLQKNVCEICTRFMGAEPICRYDTKQDGWIHFMEWELLHPEVRLRVVVNRGDRLAQFPFRNLRLYGDYCIVDFEDKVTKQAYLEGVALHKKYPGVYGKDPGEGDVARITRSSELGLFLEFKLLTGIMETHRQYSGKTGPISNSTTKTLFEKVVDDSRERNIALAIDYVLATICKKVGIGILEEPNNEHRLRLDKSTFSRWFDYYNEHFKSICPDKESKKKIMEDHQSGKDISLYAPQGDWRKD